MKHTLSVTWACIASCALFLIGYDVWLYEMWGVGQTISWQTVQFCTRNPVASAIVGLALGILTSHLQINRKCDLFATCQPMYVYVACYAVGIAIGAWCWRQVGPLP